MSEEEDFTVFPENTIIYEPDEIGRVTIQFPTKDDAIIYHEFLRAFINNELTLEIVAKKE